ncbi:LysR family transcriptional regulator [Intrasporangium calvum]|uniref:Transcriptional regulator, LysR family n=1 Tax=Intrasporangium calvum (strain ATCC 23552 / DSM 43043 / JCM 3097 / NBRC 12989 / NCIMB 10167 / NRRL B-3866 / 7 KIP) TaxID=710696 RepID=E6SBP2_INTC7|nr:LysR family transcriptional regulator [Intrasporangium calvum]ADU47373.1 transcriptional regulator, LysR family [Intrasporangium calvum DSM 43043]
MSDAGEGTTGSGLDRLGSVNLNLLVPLLAILEERSVTRAAERVGLTQPAMSHALQRMRRLLNDDLLVRHGNDVTVTPRGLELIAPVRATLERAAQVVNFPSFDPAADRRVITIAMTTSTAFVLGPRLSRLLRERAPHATLRIRTITVASASTFTEHGVDVVLLSEAFTSPYPRERLYDDRIVVVASTDTPPAATALDLLTSEPHVVVDSERRVFPYAVLDEHEVTYRVGVLVSDFLLVPYLVARGGGVALLRYRVAAEMRTLVDLRIEEAPFRLPGLGIDLVFNPHLADQYFMAWLRQLLFEAARPCPTRP